MEATLKSGRLRLIVLLAVAFAIATWVAFAIPTSTTSADDHRDRNLQDITPKITVESGVLILGECLVTTQKEVEGPIVVSEEIFETVFVDGHFIDLRDGSPITPEQLEADPSLNDVLLREPTGEFRDVIREIEIIKVISGCADNITNPDTGETFLGVRAHVSTFIVQCHKEVNFQHANCHTRRGNIDE